jgi:hypothetical protein
MPDEQEHLRKALRNETFAESLDLSSQPNPEWAIVACFYSAVHLVEAHFAKFFNYNSPTHDARKKAMAKDARTKRCFSEYAHLETLSRNCRYGVRTFTEREYANTKPLLENIKNSLK